MIGAARLAAALALFALWALLAFWVYAALAIAVRSSISDTGAAEFLVLLAVALGSLASYAFVLDRLLWPRKARSVDEAAE